MNEDITPDSCYVFMREIYWQTQAAALRVQRDELLVACRAARDAIASLELDALGIGNSDGGRTHWYIRDELLANIDAAIAAAEEETE